MIASSHVWDSNHSLSMPLSVNVDVQSAFRRLTPREGALDIHMPRYSQERKAADLKKLLPPHNRTVVSVAAERRLSS